MPEPTLLLLPSICGHHHCTIRWIVKPTEFCGCAISTNTGRSRDVWATGTFVVPLGKYMSGHAILGRASNSSVILSKVLILRRQEAETVVDRFADPNDDVAAIRPPVELKG